MWYGVVSCIMFIDNSQTAFFFSSMWRMKIAKTTRFSTWNFIAHYSFVMLVVQGETLLWEPIDLRTLRNHQNHSWPPNDNMRNSVRKCWSVCLLSTPAEQTFCIHGTPCCAACILCKATPLRRWRAHPRSWRCTTSHYLTMACWVKACWPSTKLTARSLRAKQHRATKGKLQQHTNIHRFCKHKDIRLSRKHS